uniref:Uncharacterized protein n=1 Tax=Phlebotomus papatasi TaxID=29031 RepID=A0A1B0CZ77_PHLPP
MGPCEKQKQYDLTLVASDSLNDNQTTIVIHIRDVNDMPPVFPQKMYKRTLKEEKAPTYRILKN